MRFPGDIVAEVACGVRVARESVVEVWGSEGSITVPTPWAPGARAARRGSSSIAQGDEKPEEILVETREWLYALEIDAVADNLDRRQAQPPAMTWDDSLGNMRALDLWRKSIGLTYDADKK